MKHKSVNSSTVRSVAHDPITNTLEVKFKAGTTYHYHGVSTALHNDLMNADSVGKFLNEHIKGHHDHSQQ